jgi:putative tryptophan/tyrosine transport system substrate-binding protein
MRRREFIAGLGSAAAWPAVARAQQAAMPVIGFLIAQSAFDNNNIVPFFQGLKETGYVEGQNVAVEYRYAENQLDRFPALAADLVRRRVAVIVGGGVAALAAKAATTTIPIIFATGGDPVALGLVASLNRPGGNVTGATNRQTQLVAKRLQLLHEIVPAVTSIGFLVHPTPSSDIPTKIKEAETAARILGVRLTVLNASTPTDIEAAFATVVGQRIGALIVDPDAFITPESQVVALATRHAVPAIYGLPEFVEAGGLMSYGAGYFDALRLAGTYVGRILKGEKPADLPVQQITKIELVINLKTAKALGLTIPETLLATADEVIQ